jgi:hypothetical protein
MNMVDVLRRVSDHVLIGRATRGGKDQDNYFLLCREEPASPLVSSAPVSDERNMRDVGGTPGGLGEFLVGLVMACAGGYLITQQVTVTAGFWSFYGGSAFGITLIPMLFGVGLLFFNGKSVLGWLLTVAGSVFILAGIIANMHIYFQSTSLFNTLVMLVLLVGGLGLIARSLRAHGAPAPQK